MTGNDKWQQLKQGITLFLPTLLPDETKEKVVKQCRDNYEKSKIYDLQLKVGNHCKDIEVSMILGINDIILPIILQEYAALNCTLQKIKKIAETSGIKQFVDISAITKLCDVAYIHKHCYDNLCILATRFEGVNAGELLKQYKKIVELKNGGV